MSAAAPATQIDAGQLPVIDDAELATLLPRLREQYAAASGYRAREARRWERRNPSAYVVAWMAYQHEQALDEDRERSVAAALQAGEVEQRTAAQIEVEQLPVIDDAELATLLPRLREQYAAASGYRAGEARRWERRDPSAYVVAWMAYQHEQALDENRERSVAAALQAGEMELRTAAQIEVEQLPVIDDAELATLLPRLREQYAAASGNPEPQPPELEAVSAQRSLAAELAPTEAAPEWVEWEQDGESYGQWDDEQAVEDRPEPEPPQRYRGPRMG